MMESNSDIEINQETFLLLNKIQLFYCFMILLQ